MSTTTPLRLSTTEYRWSLACRCPRMAVLKRRGLPESEITARQQRIRRRGQLFEDLVADQFIARYGTEGVQRQREVTWPGGTLHPDLYIVEERAAIEVKSSTHPASLLPDARLQNAGQQLFDPDCDAGGIATVDPVDLTETYEAVNPGDYQEQIDHILEQLAWAEQTGGLPDCTAKSPSHCRHGKFCGFTDHAWQGWTPPQPEELEANQEIRDALTDLYQLRAERAAHDSRSRALKKDEKALTDLLLELDLQPGTVYSCGPLRLKRIVIEPSVVKEHTRAGYDRFTLDRTGDEPLPAKDYGDEAPF